MKSKAVTALTAVTALVMLTHLPLQPLGQEQGQGQEPALAQGQGQIGYNPLIVHPIELTDTWQTWPTISRPSLPPLPTKKLLPTTAPTTAPTPKTSMSEIELFERIVEAEVAPHWGLDGYFLVAQTVVNQLRKGTMGTTLTDVLTYPNAYSVYSSGRYLKFVPSTKAKEAVRLALANELPSNLSISREEAHSIIAFCTDSHLARSPSGYHGRLTKVIKYENVWFFK